MERRGASRTVRRYVEERIDQVRCELAMCEARGGEGGDLGVWSTEEELIEELAELEYALATEKLGGVFAPEEGAE